MTVRAGTVVFSLVVTLVVAVRASRADDDTDPLALPSTPKAVEHWKKATEAIDASDYDTAVKEYSAGARIEDLPFWDWNLCKAHQKAARFKMARWYCRRYIERLERVSVKSDELREVIDGARANLATIEDEERREAERARVDVRPQETQQPPNAAAEQREPGGVWTTQRTIAAGVGGVAVVALGSGVLFGLRAKDLDQQAATLCPMPSCAQAAEANALIERGQDNATYANIAYGVGAVAVVGAAVLWFTGGSSADGRRANRAVAVPRVSGTFTGIDLTMEF